MVGEVTGATETVPAHMLERLPERLRQAVVSGHAPTRVLRAIMAGQNGRGPRTAKPKVDIKEFVRALG